MKPPLLPLSSPRARQRDAHPNGVPIEAALNARAIAEKAFDRGDLRTPSRYILGKCAISCSLAFKHTVPRSGQVRPGSISQRSAADGQIAVCPHHDRWGCRCAIGARPEDGCRIAKLQLAGLIELGPEIETGGYGRALRLEARIAREQDMKPWTQQGGQAGFRAGSVLPGARGRRG
jgi:hypothetical protein